MDSYILYHNAKIWNTRDIYHYKWMIVDPTSGRIIKCGTDEETINGWSGSRQNLNNQFVYPGLHDCHIHVFSLGSSLSRLNLCEVHSLQEFQQAITKYAQHHPFKSVLDQIKLKNLIIFVVDCRRGLGSGYDASSTISNKGRH